MTIEEDSFDRARFPNLAHKTVSIRLRNSDRFRCGVGRHVKGSGMREHEFLANEMMRDFLYKLIAPARVFIFVRCILDVFIVLVLDFLVIVDDGVGDFCHGG